MAQSSERHIENETIRLEVDSNVYRTPREAKVVAKQLMLLSFGCPIGHKVCGEIPEINDDYSDKNVFVAIPYSRYRYEDAIREVLNVGGLTPKIAKDKITNQVLLCKICKEMRKCGSYGVADISKNNVNVGYELGLMQSFGKKCAILLSSRSSRPTDLQGLENVTYGISRTLKKNFAKWIVGNIKECNADALRQYVRTLDQS